MILDIFVESIIEPILLGVVVIFITFLFFQFINGFLNDTASLRLTKASFKLDLLNIFDLWIAYSFLAFMIIFIYIYVPQVLAQSATNEFSIVNLYAVLFIIYLGRVFTRFEGISTGKAYFTTIVTFGLIRLFIDYRLDMLLASDISDVYLASINFASYLFAGTHNILLLFLGALILSTLGELTLSMTPANSSKANLSLIESIINPPSGIILDSNKNIIKKLYEVLARKEIRMIKCFTRSLWIVEKILQIDQNLYLKLNKSNIKVIVMPDILAKQTLLNDISDRRPSLDFILDRKTHNLTYSGLPTKKEYGMR